MFFSNSTRREKFCGKGAKPVEAVRKTHPQGMWRRSEPVHRRGKRGKLVHRGFSTCPQNPVERGCCRFPDRMNIHSLDLNAGCGEGPLPRGQKVRHPAGGRLPGGGAAPRRGGQKPFLFLRKKKRFLTPKKKLGRSTGRFRVKTAACVFTHCGEDQPRPLRPCHSGTGTGCGSILGPPGCATLAAECGGRSSRPAKEARCLGPPVRRRRTTGPPRP